MCRINSIRSLTLSGWSLFYPPEPRRHIFVATLARFTSPCLCVSQKIAVSAVPCHDFRSDFLIAQRRDYYSPAV